MDNEARKQAMAETLAARANRYLGIPLEKYVLDRMASSVYPPSRVSISTVGEPSPVSTKIIVEWGVRVSTDWNEVVHLPHPTFVDRLIGKIFHSYLVYHPPLRAGHRITATLTEKEEEYLLLLQTGAIDLAVNMPKGFRTGLVLPDETVAVLFNPDNTAFSEHEPIT